MGLYPSKFYAKIMHFRAKFSLASRCFQSVGRRPPLPPLNPTLQSAGAGCYQVDDDDDDLARPVTGRKDGQTDGRTSDPAAGKRIDRRPGRRHQRLAAPHTGTW